MVSNNREKLMFIILVLFVVHNLATLTESGHRQHVQSGGLTTLGGHNDAAVSHLRLPHCKNRIVKITNVFVSTVARMQIII